MFKVNKNTRIGFTPCKAEQPLQGMEFYKKKNHKKIKVSRKKLPINKCLLILDLKPFRS